MKVSKDIYHVVSGMQLITEQMLILLRLTAPHLADRLEPCHLAIPFLDA